MMNKIKSINANKPYIKYLVGFLLLILIFSLLIYYFGYYVVKSNYYGFKLEYKFGYCSEVKDHGFRLSADFPEIKAKRVFFFNGELIHEAVDNAISNYISKYSDLIKPEDLDENGNVDPEKFVENHKEDVTFQELFIKHLYLSKYEEGDLENMETFINNMLRYIDEFERREINRKYNISSPTLFYEIMSNDRNLLCEHLFEYYLNK